MRASDRRLGAGGLMAAAWLLAGAGLVAAGLGGLGGVAVSDAFSLIVAGSLFTGCTEPLLVSGKMPVGSEDGCSDIWRRRS